METSQQQQLLPFCPRLIAQSTALTRHISGILAIRQGIIVDRALLNLAFDLPSTKNYKIE
jgi:hypothetical protein